MKIPSAIINHRFCLSFNGVITLLLYPSYQFLARLSNDKDAVEAIGLVFFIITIAVFLLWIFITLSIFIEFRWGIKTLAD